MGGSTRLRTPSDLGPPHGPAINSRRRSRLMNRALPRIIPPLCLLFGLLAAPGARGVGAVPATAPPSQLNWMPCADVPDSQCAGLPVPLDPDRPDGAQLTLRLARVPTANPGSNKPSLLIIPGGPGAGIVD